MNNELWNKIMSYEKADTRHRPRPDEVANDLKEDEINTILATIEYFGASIRDMQQVYFDLIIARYRVFDWLAMCVMGRIDHKPSVQVLCHSFIKSEGNVDAFIQDLRVTDYEIDRSWEHINVEEEDSGE